MCLSAVTQRQKKFARGPSPGTQRPLHAAARQGRTTVGAVCGNKLDSTITGVDLVREHDHRRPLAWEHSHRPAFSPRRDMIFSLLLAATGHDPRPPTHCDRAHFPASSPPGNPLAREYDDWRRAREGARAPRPSRPSRRNAITSTPIPPSLAENTRGGPRESWVVR